MPQPIHTVNAPVARTSVAVIKQRVVGETALPPESDTLAIEDPLEISLCFQRNQKPIEKKLVVTMRTPGRDRELIHGFLYCEGIIQSAADILVIEFNPNHVHAAPTQAKVQLRPDLEVSQRSSERNFAVHSSCGVCGTTSIGHLEIPKSLRIADNTRIDPNCIHALPQRMHAQQATFHDTGGLHASALFHNNGELLNACEDIGRHNALDKVIGANLIARQIPGRGQILCVSGRMSYEILQKALIARIPIITGVGAPSSLAVALANDFNITLIGFVRNDSYNIYSCPERLITN